MNNCSVLMDQPKLLIETLRIQVFAASLSSLRLFPVVCQHVLIHLSRSLGSQGENVYRPISSFWRIRPTSVFEVFLAFLQRGSLLEHWNIGEDFQDSCFPLVALGVSG